MRIIRNGETIKDIKRKRDLLVWRGQSILAYLISQGAVGSSTSAWKVVASNNNESPDMGDDSGDPLNNEFDSVLGTPVAVTWTFEPETKPSGGYQTFGQITAKGTVIITTSGTVRKIGIIDSTASPNCRIIVEDAVVPQAVLEEDEIEIWYFAQLG